MKTVMLLVDVGCAIVYVRLALVDVVVPVRFEPVRIE